MAQPEGPGRGGGKFLPLPILASVVFITLAMGTHYAGPTTVTEYGTFPSVARLLGTQPDPESVYYPLGIAYDTIASISISGSEMTIRFASLPSQEFTTMIDESVLAKIMPGIHIYAGFYYFEYSHSWHFMGIYIV